MDRISNLNSGSSKNWISNVDAERVPFRILNRAVYIYYRDQSSYMLILNNNALSFALYALRLHQHSGKLKGTCIASPPSEVSLYLLFISSAVSHMVRMTASRDTFAKSGILCRAS